MKSIFCITNRDALSLLLAYELCRCILWDLSRSFLLRLAITIFSIILIYTMAQVNVVSATFPTVHNVK
jgi:adenylate cyclase 1